MRPYPAAAHSAYGDVEALGDGGEPSEAAGRAGTGRTQPEPPPLTGDAAVSSTVRRHHFRPSFAGDAISRRPRPLGGVPAPTEAPPLLKGAQAPPPEASDLGSKPLRVWARPPSDPATQVEPPPDPGGRQANRIRGVPRSRALSLEVTRGTLGLVVSRASVGVQRPGPSRATRTNTRPRGVLREPSPTVAPFSGESPQALRTCHCPQPGPQPPHLRKKRPGPGAQDAGGLS